MEQLKEDILEILIQVQDEKQIETDSFIISLKNEEKSRKYAPDWRTVLSNFLHDQQIKRINVTLYDKLNYTYTNLFRLSSKKLKKLYMELLLYLDDHENYIVGVDSKKLFSVTKI